jgi:DNA-directed RNA polymerase specialized sigma24 family protein
MTGTPAQEPSADGQPADVGVTQFEVFYRRFFPVLVSWSIWAGADPSLAADVAQFAMKKAWASWSTIANPEAWTWTTGRRELVRRQKAGNRELLAGSVPVSELLPLDDKGIKEFETRHVLIWALRQLPSRQREVMFWSFLDYQPSEIASILLTSPGAVRSSLKIARRKMAELLYGSAEGDNDVR